MAPKVNRSMHSAALGLFLCWTIILLVLSFAPPGWLHPIGRAIEHLGQFGDAFAPVTAFFAMYAAIFAWQSYQTQRQQLEHERSRSRFSAWDHDLYSRTAGFNELSKLPGQVVAIVRWLRSSAVEEQQDYASLLDSNLSDNEAWFWQRSIAATGDADLISFAGSWNIFGPDRGMTEEEASLQTAACIRRSVPLRARPDQPSQGVNCSHP
jgi:hypothetical protein